MLSRPSVIITAIIVAGLVLVALIAGVVLLAYTGHSTEALTGVIAAPLIAILVSQTRRMAELKVTAEQIQHQTRTPTE